jgi:hypothetical protein
MKRIHLTSILAAAAATGAGLVMITMAAQSAHAQINAGGQRRLVTDGSGNVNAAAGSGFNTAAGGQGLRTRSFNRDADGSVSARGQGSATGATGASAQRSGSYTRSADGSSASGERNTPVTGANGGTVDGSTTYTKGSGFSRSASCKDSSGNTVSCTPR